MTPSYMLSLDDPAWSQLTHAYGEAGDIPDLLRNVEASPGPVSDRGTEPWQTLWSSLCHQDDVYTASYAAVPHLVRIALEVEKPVDFSLLLLPAAIEISRNRGRGPEVPDFLEPGYRAAIKGLPDCVCRHSHHDWDKSFLMSALTAVAVAKGHHIIAEAIMLLDDDWVARIIDDERD